MEENSLFLTFKTTLLHDSCVLYYGKFTIPGNSLLRVPGRGYEHCVQERALTKEVKEDEPMADIKRMS